MQRTKLTRVLAATAALAVFGAACGGGDEPTTDGTPSDGESTPAATGGEVSTYIAEPEHLFPQNTNESEGNAVLAAMYKGLVDYDIETTEMFLQVAESIETEDNKSYTITLKDGWTFHNGEAVTASSFVDAWNYAADADNAMGTRSFFANIMGFVDEGEGADADALEGLVVVDDKTFTVELINASPSFPIQLGYTAYYPLPTVAYEDPAAFEEAPIGNGPFMIEGSWVHDEEIVTVRFDDYAGTEPAKIDKLTFKIFAEQDAAYNALLAGEIDIMDSLPAPKIEEAQATFGDKFGESPRNSITYVGMPSYVDYLGNKDLRRALSMAIDKDNITQGPIFNGNRQTAHSFIPPLIPGYRPEVCGNWDYDPTTAKELWDANAYDGDITIWFNSGAGHEEWTAQVRQDWINNLGLDGDKIKFESLEFADYLPLIDGQELTGPFRLGWGMDYPHPENFTEPLFSSANLPPDGSNSTFTEDATIDDLIAQGKSQTTLEAAIPFYQQVEDVLCDEVVVIPMFFSKNQFASSDQVQGLTVDAFGNINYTGISVAS